MGDEELRSGWSFLKVIGVLIGLLGMFGFGVCSLCGFGIAASDRRDPAILMLALAGAGIAALFGWMVAAIIRRVKRDRERD